MILWLCTVICTAAGFAAGYCKGRADQAEIDLLRIRIIQKIENAIRDERPL